jgi:uncharacterized protein DUF3795
MEIVCSSPQYRQDPHLWATDLSPRRAKKPAAREFGLSVGSRTGKALPKFGFSTVSLGGYQTQERDRHRMSDSKLLLGVCGLYCGACYHYRASFPESKYLLEEANRQGRELEGFTCAGCRSDTLYIHPGCAKCKIRACAESKSILHCGLCLEFPCNQIKAFQSDGRLHHLDVILNLEDLRAKQPEQWLAEQQQRWKCGCGASFSWYEKTCHSCGAVLNTYGDDPRR